MEKKCKHEKICQECVREEIKALEEKVSELKKKLPHDHTTIIREYIEKYPIYPKPWYPKFPDVTWYSSTTSIPNSTYQALC